MLSSDGIRYRTDVLDTENVLRLVTSIPLPKAEPFKLWLARVGYERIEETEDRDWLELERDYCVLRPIDSRRKDKISSEISTSMSARPFRGGTS